MNKITTLGLIIGILAMLSLAGCGQKALTPPAAPTAPVELPKAAEAPTPSATPVELPLAAPVPSTSENAKTPDGAESDLGISAEDLDVGENPDTGVASDVDVSIE